MKRKKILVISDHCLATSGVGTQMRYLASGLVATGKYELLMLGAAIKHTDYTVRNLNGDPAKPEDIVKIKPIDGFGDENMIRMILATEKPDAILIFTDPRFFQHIFHMENEIHQCCPILYNYLWDNDPFPTFNMPVFECIDCFNCISHHTYTAMMKNLPEELKEKVNYVPHGVPKEIFFPLSLEQVKEAKERMFGVGSTDKFFGFWANRNARRKNPGDLIHAWKLFIDKLEKEYGHRNAILMLHTDPLDQEGPNLYKMVELFNLKDVVAFSTDRIGFDQMNILHNMSDFYINISLAEGFGLGSLEAMMAGKPVILQKTGGQTVQVVNHNDGSINGIALDPDVKTLIGSQSIYYIHEDLVKAEKVADAIFEMYEWGPEKRKQVGLKAMEYAQSWFDLNNTVKKWDETLEDTMKNWKDRRKNWALKEI